MVDTFADSLPKKAFLRPDEVAYHTGFSKRTVYRWIDEGRFDTIQIGKAIRICRASLLKFLCQQRTPVDSRT